jgi:thioredoxin reductase
MSGAVRNRNAMTEQMLASEPALAEAFECGVDVRLGTIVWGLYENGASVGWLPGKVAGLSDGETSAMLGFKSAIVAAGRRDMGLAFPGWHLPGVMGATAAERLASRYAALDARRAVVLGTTAEALLAALAMHRAGTAVVSVIEQAAAAAGPASLLAEIAAAGIAVMTRHIIAAAHGGVEGVTAAEIVALDEAGHRIAGSAETIACDTIVLGIAAVPVIELLDSLGCRIAFSAERGGHVPVVDDAQMTSLPGIYAIGDCCGVWPEKSADRAIAEAEGRRAAAHAAGIATDTDAAIPQGATAPEYRLAWMRHAVIEANAEAHVCQCEEVTARDILEVRPPRYLQWERPLRNRAELTELLGNGAPNPDQVKRLTRAGMGLCQGRRCREQVAALLALGAAEGLDKVPLATHRAPVRPLPLGLAGTLPESAAMAEHWDVWFGIPGQVTSYWEIEP